jgi:carbon-monoxide dehydrogenase small subunit
MTIGFILNGEDVTIRTEADTRLLDILRDFFKLPGAKCGCLTGSCGACSVIFNGNTALSCLIPAFRIRGCEIITVEGFSQTDEYQDILRGFSQAGLETCGFCDTGKILAAESLLEKTPRPSLPEILAAFDDIRCRCTDPGQLIEGVLIAADIRQRRLYGRSA